MDNIPFEEAQQKIKAKTHLYDAMVGINWYLPDIKARICTEEFLNRVRHGEVFALKWQDVRKRPCRRPPPSNVL